MPLYSVTGLQISIINIMNKTNISYVFLILILISPTLHQPPPQNSPPANPNKPTDPNPSEQGNDDMSMVVLDPIFSGNSFFSILPMVFIEDDYQNFDLDSLTDQQKQVDDFIRKQVDIPSQANLTNASGSDKKFRYSYSEKKDESQSSWIITVLKLDEEESEDKYQIIGRQIIVNRPLTQKEKEQLENQLIEAEKESEQAAKQFQEGMKLFDTEMQNMDTMLENIFG